MKNILFISSMILLFLLCSSAKLADSTDTLGLLDTQLSDQENKLNSTIEAMTGIAVGILDYITDHGVAPDQEGIYDESSKIYKDLVPFYIHNMPIKDEWGNNYVVICGTSCNGVFGIPDCVDDDFMVISYGKNGKQDNWQFDKADPMGGFYQITSLDDYNKDLVLWNGTWIKAPEYIIKEGI